MATAIEKKRDKESADRENDFHIMNHHSYTTFIIVAL